MYCIIKLLLVEQIPFDSKYELEQARQEIELYFANAMAQLVMQLREP